MNRTQACAKGGGRGGTCPPRFWQIRRRRRQRRRRRITVCPPRFLDFDTCLIWDLVQTKQATFSSWIYVFNFHLLIKTKLIMNVLLRLHTPNLGLILGAFLINRKEHGENVTMDKIFCYCLAHDKDNKVLPFITKYHYSCRHLLT